MTGLILKLVLAILVLRALMRLFKGMVDGLRGTSTAPRSVALVRDPICGTFVLPERSISVADARGRVFFCSEACRDKYRAKSA
jgi:YHS domain-containing protein